MTKSIFITLIIFIHLSTTAQNIDFEFDYTQFGYDTLSNYLEIYYSFGQNSLQVVNTDSSDYISGSLGIEIINSASGDEIVNKVWTNNVVIDSFLIGQKLIGVLGFLLEQGDYKLSVTGSDVNNIHNSKLINVELKVTPIIQDNFSLSEIQLAANIIPGSLKTSSIFYKNTYEVIPLPSPVTGENQPIVYYYLEVYGIQKSVSQNNLRIDEILTNSMNQVLSFKSKYLNKSEDTRVEVGKINAYKYPTDIYTLEINLIDSAASFGISSSKKFFNYNPSVAVVDTFIRVATPILSTIFGSMSEEELDDLFEKSEYIATENEIDRFEALSNVDAKRNFMYNFWLARDEDPSDDRNQFFIDYLNRISVANEKYAGLSKPGWKTDRGRVLLKYGPPSEVDRYPSQLETKPYEIWTYERLEGGVKFIFGDLRGFNDYELLHSTKRGELHDDYWQRKISVQ